MRLDGAPRGWGPSGFEHPSFGKDLLYSSMVSDANSLKESMSRVHLSGNSAVSIDFVKWICVLYI
jgi:hypothetical protein